MQYRKINTSGFTLIELMVVLAIIGMLSVIAIPVYSDYQTKTKVGVAYAEISAGRANFELKRDAGDNITMASDIGLKSNTNNCNITVSNTDITCTITNAPTQVNTKVIRLNKPAAGTWSCQAPTIDAKYKPKNCT